MRSPDEIRVCVVGAGYAGLGAAKALRDAGLPYDHLESTDQVGGNWALRIYGDARLISSRRTTGYRDFPMPRHYPTFPTRDQMRAYLEAFADRFGLRERIEFETEVVRCEPRDEGGLGGWQVELRSGETRDYSAVIMANGHHWDARMPSYPGEFTGRQLHSVEYRRAADLSGPRVLVVGGGTSGSDIAVHCAEEFGRVDISLRHGAWIMPKTFLGLPTCEFDSRWIPPAYQKPAARAIVRLGNGSVERYGLERPEHDVFDRDLTVSSTFVPAVRAGKVRPRREIARLDGRTVRFVDGTSAEYDTILWATGYNVSFPMLDHALLAWDDGAPELVAHVLPPGLANLVLFGLINPHAGAGRLISDVSDLVVEVLAAQPRVATPIPDLVARKLEPTSSMLMAMYDMYRDMRVVRRVTRRAARGAPARRPRLAPAASTARKSPVPR